MVQCLTGRFGFDSQLGMVTKRVRIPRTPIFIFYGGGIGKRQAWTERLVMRANKPLGECKEYPSCMVQIHTHRNNICWCGATVAQLTCNQ